MKSMLQKPVHNDYLKRHVVRVNVNEPLLHCSWEHYGNSRLSKIEAITKKTLPQIHCIRTDAANLEHESESTNLPALFLLMIHARRLFYTAAIFFLWSPLFPILNLVKVFAIVSCWD